VIRDASSSETFSCQYLVHREEPTGSLTTNNTASARFHHSRDLQPGMMRHTREGSVQTICMVRGKHLRLEVRRTADYAPPLRCTVGTTDRDVCPDTGTTYRDELSMKAIRLWTSSRHGHPASEFVGSDGGDDDDLSDYLDDGGFQDDVDASDSMYNFDDYADDDYGYDDYGH